MKRLLTITSILVLLILCHHRSNTVEDIQNEKKNEGSDTVSDTTVTAVYEAPDIIAPDKTGSEADRKIIKTANIKLELRDLETFNTHIRKTIQQFGGYIASEQQANTDDQLENTITVKIPSDRFETFINSLKGSDIKVIERSITSEDVSAEFIDSKSRMEARKQVRQRYFELLRDAKKMSDVLSIQNEINSTQEEIEAATGRMKYLSAQSAFSTVHLTYVQYVTAKLPQSDSYFTKLMQAFANGFEVIGSVLLVFVSLWPLLIVAIIAWLLAKRTKIFSVKAQNKTRS